MLTKRTMPAEWLPHSGTALIWPAREAIWRLGFEAAKQCYADIINTIADFEPVLLIVAPQQLAEAKRYCRSDNVEFVALPVNDSWARDQLPLWVQDPTAGWQAVDFIFNSWGEKYPPFDDDQALGERLCQAKGWPRQASPLILEGGAVHVDGEGRYMTTAECLDVRNPNLSREQMHQLINDALGTHEGIWLPYGMYGDHDTDGHIDNIACFLPEKRILTMHAEDNQDANAPRFAANAQVLLNSGFEVESIPQPARVTLEDEEWALSYINFVFVNGAVIIPSFEQPRVDDIAARRFAELLPDHEVVQLPVMPLLAGGGGMHCITQQQPRGAW